MKPFYISLSLLVLFTVYLYYEVNSEEPLRTNISYHDMDTLAYNQFAFPELLDEADKKIIERYEYLGYFKIVDEKAKRIKLDSTIKNKTIKFSFLDDVYSNIEKEVKWENENILDSMDSIVNYTTETYLDIYRLRPKYKRHEKKQYDINK